MGGLHIIKSKYSAEETASRVKEAIEAEGLNLFAKINHAAQAQNAGIELNPTTVFIFGNPSIGSLLMQENQTVAIDLPVKILVWEDKNGEVKVAYNTTDWLKQRHHLDQSSALEKISEKLHTISSKAAGIIN